MLKRIKAAVLIGVFVVVVVFGEALLAHMDRKAGKS